MKPNGVFFVDARGAHVMESALYSADSKDVRLATQSGPLLLVHQAINPIFKSGSESRRIRSGVGTRSPQEVCFVISNQPVTFYEFASIFRDALHCTDALYLDGVISKFHVDGEKLKPNGGEGEFAGILAVVAPAEPR